MACIFPFNSCSGSKWWFLHHCDSGYYWKIKENSKSIFILFLLQTFLHFLFWFLLFSLHWVPFLFFVCFFTLLHILLISITESFLILSFYHKVYSCIILNFLCYQIKFFCCILPLCYFLMQFIITISWFLYTTFLYQLFFILWAHFFKYFHAALCKSLNLIKSK